MEIEKRISLVLDEFFEREMNDLFAVEIVVAKGLAAVYVDGDNGVTIDQCRTINKHLRAALSDDTEFSDNYALEVSSPGADRPLKFWRQYPKHVGRTLHVRCKDGSETEGRLKELQATTLILEKKEKKKKEEIIIPFDEVEESLVIISFK